MQDMIENSQQGDIFRTVSITLQDREGADFRTRSFQESFITQYTFPDLNADQDDVTAIEEIIIQPGYSEDFFSLN